MASSKIRYVYYSAVIACVLVFIFSSITSKREQRVGYTLPSPGLQAWTGPNFVPTIIGPAVSLHSGQGAQTYPRAVKLRSGVLLAALTAFEPENAIVLSTSRDSGASWAPYSTVIKAPTTNIQLNNAFLFEASDGRILCALRCHTMKPEAIGAEEKPGGQNEGYLYYQLQIYYSDDVGKTWHYLSTPVQEPGPVHGIWEPFLRTSNKGDLQLYYSREEGGRDQDNLMRFSRDGGLSWSSDIFVSGLGLASRDGMMGIQELSPGSGHLMAVFESVEEKGAEGTFNARFGVWSVLSTDDGKTWSDRRMIYESFFNKPAEHSLSRFLLFSLFRGSADLKKLGRNAGAPAIAKVGNTLVVSFMTDEEKLEGMWHRNAYVKIITSDDGGATWGNKLIIAEMPAAWAGLLALNDTNFLVLCEHDDRVEARPVALLEGSR